GGLDRLGHVAVMLENCAVVLAGPGLCPCPRDGEAEEAAAQPRGQRDVLEVAVAEVGGRAARGPRVRLLPVVVDVFESRLVCLALVVGCCDPEEKVAWQRSAHV